MSGLEILKDLLEIVSQRKVASRLGVHRNTVNRWKNGKQSISQIQSRAIRDLYQEIRGVQPVKDPSQDHDADGTVT